MGILIFSYSQPTINLPRSYVRQIAVLSDYQVDPVLVGNDIIWTSAAGYVYTVALETRFRDWNSNVYSPPFMFNEPGSSIDCVLFPCLDGLAVGYGDIINDRPPMLFLHPTATMSLVRLVDLPAAPPDYWLPPFPP